MKRTIFSKRTGNFMFLVMASLSLTGCCMVSANYRGDEAIGRESVQKIRCGETTRQDIVTRLGPPLVIARKGKSMKYSAPRMATVRFVERSSEPFLELFSTDRVLRDNEAVYYYRATERNETGFLIILLLINTGNTVNEVQTEHLWLLIDETSGIVEDVVYRDRDRHRTGCTDALAPDRGK
jgi:hypothetical protein